MQIIEKNLDFSSFFNAFSPKLKNAYIIAKKAKKVNAMKKYDTIPNLEKNTAISLPLAKPEPITVPMTIMVAEKVFFTK